MKPDIHSGIAAISLKGRDKGRAFVVLCQLDADFVLLADGQLRTLARPKKKRSKHLRAIGHDLPGFQAAFEAGTLTDQTIRAFLISLKDLHPKDPA
ncbi:MAG: KOW domain-containing RNA-binding protein [Bacillota bacterium]|nr:KOW domain-containing RNA-binding protein [Bacillota bacterium]